jgi:hypothetical protein
MAKHLKPAHVVAIVGWRRDKLTWEAIIVEAAKVVGENAAELFCHAFAKHNIFNTLLWLDQVGIQRRIAKKLTDFYKDEAQAKIEANPYALISFKASWKAIDELASNSGGRVKGRRGSRSGAEPSGATGEHLAQRTLDAPAAPQGSRADLMKHAIKRPLPRELR